MLHGMGRQEAGSERGLGLAAVRNGLVSPSSHPPEALLHPHWLLVMQVLDADEGLEGLDLPVLQLAAKQTPCTRELRLPIPIRALTTYWGAYGAALHSTPVKSLHFPFTILTTYAAPSSCCPVSALSEYRHCCAPSSHPYHSTSRETL